MLKLHNEEVCKTCIDPPNPSKNLQKVDVSKKKFVDSALDDTSDSLRKALGTLEEDFRNLKKYLKFLLK